MNEGATFSDTVTVDVIRASQFNAFDVAVLIAICVFSFFIYKAIRNHFKKTDVVVQPTTYEKRGLENENQNE